MAYTFYDTVAFPSGEGHEEGYDYQTADELLRRVQNTAIGRVYIDERGYLVYESRFTRTV